MEKDNKREARYRRRARIRAKLKGTTSRPRLCVFRSLNHIHAQIVDDLQGHTLTAASSLESEIKAEVNGKNKSSQAGVVGSLVAKRALNQKINQVVFDRSGYKYHGRVKALAEAAKKVGLKF